MELLPTTAAYYWARVSVHRALDEHVLQEEGHKHGLEGKAYATVEEAYDAAMSDADEADFVYVGGSSFVVADLLTFLLDCRSDRA